MPLPLAPCRAEGPSELSLEAGVRRILAYPAGHELEEQDNKGFDALQVQMGSR